MSEKDLAPQWAVVELFGHQRMAGAISEQSFGGCNFVRVDVPETTGASAFTRLLGNAAIYAINFTTEANARAAAEYFGIRPIQSYEMKQLPQPPSPGDPGYDYGDVDPFE